MAEEKRTLVDVGISDLPFPIKALSKVNPDGQSTIAHISIKARIMREFEARWIDKFVQVLHKHRETVGTGSLRKNISDYMKELNASAVRIDFEYPFFIEKLTPVSKEKCLVQYHCSYSAKVPSVEKEPRAIFAIKVPCITAYPMSDPDVPGGVFGQLSVVTIEVESAKDIYPEDLVAITDKHAQAPVYSFMTPEDQIDIIRKIHSGKKSSVVMVDEIKGDLMRNRDIGYYSVTCANYGMLHSYSTIIRTEKSMWMPVTGSESEEI